MPGPRFAVACVLAAISVARPARGGDDETPVVLTWKAPNECPSGAEVSARIAERLPTSTSVRAKGRITKESGRYRLVLEIESKGERVLEARTCEALASSAAVVLAMSVAQQPDNEPAGAEPPPPPPPVRAIEPRPNDPERPTVDRSRITRRRFGARLHAIGDAGTLPTIGAGGGLAFGFDPASSIHLEISGNLWARQNGTLAADASRGAAFQLVTAGARGCWSVTSPITLGPCIGAEITVLSGSGFGAYRTVDATALAWAPEASLTLGVPIGDRVVLRAGLGATAPASRQAFVIAQGGDVHRPSAIVTRGWFGPEITF